MKKLIISWWKWPPPEFDKRRWCLPEVKWVDEDAEKIALKKKKELGEESLVIIALSIKELE